jgi:gustatory receptor
MLNILKLILFVGILLAVTPSRRLYGWSVLLLLTIGVVVSTFFKKSDYMSLISVKLVVAIFMDATLFIFNCVIIVAATSWKRKQWNKLMRNLKMMSLQFNNLASYVSCLLIHLIFWAVTVYDTYAWTDIMGIEFFKQYGVEILQSYLLFHYQYLIYVILLTLLSSYRNLISRLPSCAQINYSDVIKIKHHLSLLQATVQYFNDVFGWSFLLIILYTSLQVLNYFDDSFKSGSLYDENEYDEVIISNVCFLIITAVIFCLHNCYTIN